MDRNNALPATENRNREGAAIDIARPAPAGDRARLYLLSFLLTADCVKAERCTVTGLDLFAEDNETFRDWAHSWARRIILENALRLIAPQFDTSTQGADSGQDEDT